MANSSNYDCTTCGACCASIYDSETYVYVGEHDIRRLRVAYSDQVVEGLVGDIDDPYKRGIRTKETPGGNDVCIALRGPIGGDCSCSIYESRPEVCRAFMPGDIGCTYARKAAGLEP